MRSVVMGRVGLLWLKSTLIELLGRNPTQRFIGTVKEPGIAILHHWCRTFCSNWVWGRNQTRNSHQTRRLRLLGWRCFYRAALNGLIGDGKDQPLEAPPKNINNFPYLTKGKVNGCPKCIGLEKKFRNFFYRKRKITTYFFNNYLYFS